MSPRKRDAVTLALSPDAKQNLEAIALSLGCKWGDRGNVSLLLERIAAGDLVVVDEANHELKVGRSLVEAEQALQSALKAIKKAKK
ncbi:MAG: hypothetical protein KME11_05155 [Timaviella obliquedivisa GSE-PSE-MK23-08B]|jgi:hypothetical protein|nr:hypothetical protein [Timaviella obliquedivisa GSE-PSE-MK23-08B]